MSGKEKHSSGSSPSSHNINLALQEAGFKIKQRTQFGDNKVVELDPTHSGDHEVFIFESERGVLITLHISLDARSNLWRLNPESEKALLILGTLTFGLQSRDIQAGPLTQENGLCGFQLSAHMYPGQVDANHLRNQIAELVEVATRLAGMLHQNEATLIPDILAAVRYYRSAPIQSPLNEHPVVIPKVSEAALNADSTWAKGHSM